MMMQSAGRLLTALLLPFLAQAVPSGPKHVYYNWTLEAFLDNAFSPDCMNDLYARRHLYLAERSLPGPVIDVDEGDIVHVSVTNLHPSAVTTIHYHGIHQRGTPYMDGPSYITQCPIGYKQTQEYVFEAYPPGTHYWHAHHSMHINDGLSGSLVVRPKKPEPFTYDEERTMFLRDWYIHNGEDQLVGLRNVPFQWIGDPNSILINGKGLAPECDVGGANFGNPNKCLETCNVTDKLSLLSTTEVEAGKTYRLRIINSAHLLMLNFAIAGHNLTIVAVEGTIVEPFVVESLDISPGERFDVLLHANQPAGSYLIEASNRIRVLASRGDDFVGQAVLQYASASPEFPTERPDHPARADPEPGIARDAALFTKHPAMRDEYPALKVPDKKVRRYILSGTPGFTSGGALVWAMNNVSYVKDGEPLISRAVRRAKDVGFPFDEPLEGTEPLPLMPPVVWDYENQPSWVPGGPGLAIDRSMETTVELEEGEVVEFVMQNSFVLPGVVDFHPWHIHGHSFWVVGAGKGNYDPDIHVPTYNLKNPVLRDTATLWEGEWMAIRVYANNPGVWFMHCHQLGHEVIGMAYSIITQPDVLEYPSSELTQCLPLEKPKKKGGKRGKGSGGGGGRKRRGGRGGGKRGH